MHIITDRLHRHRAYFNSETGLYSTDFFLSTTGGLRTTGGLGVRGVGTGFLDDSLLRGNGCGRRGDGSGRTLSVVSLISATLIVCVGGECWRLSIVT